MGKVTPNFLCYLCLYITNVYPRNKKHNVVERFCVIMAGGIGSRFWPMSTNDRPKQFLDFFGTGKSLLQMTFDRFRQVMPSENILIVSNRQYKDLILEQLPELKAEQVLLEPMRRNTAPCIYYAVSRIKSYLKSRGATDASMVVAPSDHLILKEGDFLDSVRRGFDFVEQNDALLTLGITPSRPETGYGYIQIGEGSDDLCKVKAFTEKPNRELANVFFQSGEFFWNAGIFLWSLRSIDAAFRMFLPEMVSLFERGEEKFGTNDEEGFINDIYPNCQNISIDYGVLEKATNIHVLTADFGWSDLGTWGSLRELSEKDEQGNAMVCGDVMMNDCKGNVIAVGAGKLLVLQGIENCIVAESDGVMLVCKLEDEQKIRQIVNDVAVKFDGKFT